jgi:uncharacterized protein YutE (UPF0331/DUF86 family)
MIEKTLVCGKLAQLRERQQLLDQLAAETREVFLADPIKRSAAERALQVGIEVCLDIGQHLIAALGLRRPTEYREVFRILGKGQVVTPELAARLEHMAGFRKRLVHGHATVEPQRVYEFLHDDRRDLDEFARAVAVFVRARLGEPQKSE